MDSNECDRNLTDSAISEICNLLAECNDGEFIKEWASSMDAERELHIQHSNITKCCKKQPHNKTAGGFIWKYKE